MCIPFAWGNPKVLPLSSMDVDWIGRVDPKEYWSYADYGLLLIFGGIPWQVYFQRVLSSKSAARAQILSYVAAFGCILMAIPPVLIGAIAKSTRKSLIIFHIACSFCMIWVLILFHITLLLKLYITFYILIFVIFTSFCITISL